MSSHVSILGKLMSLELKWAVREEIIMGAFSNFLACTPESTNDFFKFSWVLIQYESSWECCSSGSSGSLLEKEKLHLCGVYICRPVKLRSD